MIRMNHKILELVGRREDDLDMLHMNLGPEKVDYISPIHNTESRPRSSKTGSLLLPTLTYFPWIFIKPKKR